MNHAYCVGLNPGWKKMQFQLPLNKTFCPNPQSLSHQQLKQCQRTKIKKTIFLPPSSLPHWFSTQSSEYQNWKADKYSTLAENELGPMILECSTMISKFYAPNDSKLKFYKTKTKNWLLIGYNLGSSSLGTCSHNRYTMFIP